MDEEPLTKERLLTDYPPRSRGLTALALREYTTITIAREHGWQWIDIAIALDIPRSKARQLSDAYRNIYRQIANGKLTPPGTSDQYRAGRTNHQKSGFTQIKTEPGTPTEAKNKSTNSDQNMFDGSFNKM